MTPEAILVSQLDNLDAKVAMSLAAVDPDRTGGGDGVFTERMTGLGHRMYRGNALGD